MWVIWDCQNTVEPLHTTLAPFSLAALVSKLCCNSANYPFHCRLFAHTVTQCFMFDFTYGCKLSTCGMRLMLAFLYHLWPKNKEMLHSVFVSTSWKASLLLQNFQCRSFLQVVSCVSSGRSESRRVSVCWGEASGSIETVSADPGCWRFPWNLLLRWLLEKGTFKCVIQCHWRYCS